MRFEKTKDMIEIFGKEEFCPTHIFECGQIFSYKKFEIESRFSGRELSNGEKIHVFDVFSLDKKAEIFETCSGYEIVTECPEYFVDFFDLKTDYSKIKEVLLTHEIMKGPIEFGDGIRILKQNLFETLISFIVSANNNIKRIQMILERIRENFGKKKNGYFAFPTRENLLNASVSDFQALGAGYRGEYLFKVLRQVDEIELENWKTLSTNDLRNKLISLSGVGPKVADCVLLFGYGRGDVFPVDTWVEKVFYHFYPSFAQSLKSKNEIVDKKDLKSQKHKENEDSCSQKQSTKKMSREKIREFLTDEFGQLSGYAQQYLFYYMRSSKV